jgi:hypothetical protein
MRKDRKTGLFNTTVMFEAAPGDMHYTPDEREVTDNLTQLLDEMNSCVRSATRVLEHITHENYIKNI